jgi:putative oxygen-independent coproporphyrinogen III oxidase
LAARAALESHRGADPMTTAIPATETAGVPALAAGLGLYVHTPFCATKCPYCDFYSGVFPTDDVPGFVAAMAAEVEATAADPALAPWLADGGVTSVFFGGGTPSHLEAAALRRLFALVAESFPIAPGTEITVECNPESLTPEKADLLVELGVNRVSVGVQSLDDHVLQALGRPHDAKAAYRAARLARERFPRVNFDLILATPHLTRAALGSALDRLLALGPDHLSAYGLTFEPGTVFGVRAARGELLPAADEEYLAQDELVMTKVAAAGLHRYEISNYAHPGRECAHNLDIWRGGYYLGLGPSAASTLPGGPFGRRRTNVRDLARYVASWRTGTGVRSEEHLDREAAILESLLLGLRLTSGVDRERFAHRFGIALDRALGAALPPLVAAGFLAADQAALRLTPRGRPLLDAILGRLASGLAVA